MSLGFDPSEVPLHQYLALAKHYEESIGARMTGHGVAAAFGDEDT